MELRHVGTLCWVSVLLTIAAASDQGRWDLTLTQVRIVITTELPFYLFAGSVHVVKSPNGFIISFYSMCIV